MKRLLAQVLLCALVGNTMVVAQTAAPAPKKRKAPKASAPSVAGQLKTMSEALEAQQKQIQELRQEIQTRDQAVQQLQQRLDQSQAVATQAQAKADTARYQWCAAVNNHGGYGRWGYDEISSMAIVASRLDTAIQNLYADGTVTGLRDIEEVGV